MEKLTHDNMTRAERLFCDVITVAICAVLSIIPVLVGRGYVGYRLDARGDIAWVGLVEFWPALRLKYLIPLFYVCVTAAVMGVGPFLRDTSIVLAEVVVLGIIAFGASFLFPSLDRKPPDTNPGG